MFRVLSTPIIRSTKYLHLQNPVNITSYCYLLLSWKRWNWKLTFSFNLFI